MKSFINELRWLFAPEDKRKFIFITLLMALSALMELLGIGILLGGAAVFLAPESANAVKMSQILGEVLPGIDPQYHAAWAIGAIAILLVAKNIFAALIVNIQSRFIFAKRNELAVRLYKTFLNADYETFSRLSPDYCFSSFTRLHDAGNLVLLPSMQVLADFLVIIILTTVAIILFPVISCAGIGFMLLVTLAVLAFTNRRNKKLGEKLLTASFAENRMRQAGINGKKSILCAANESYFIRKFSVANANMNNIYRKIYNIGQLPRFSLESAAILLASGIFVMMVIKNVPHSEIMLTFAVLTAVIGRILPALSRTHYNLTLIRQHLPLLESFCRDLRELPGEPEAASPAADAGDPIEFKNLTFAYQDGKNIFENFNLSIPANSSLAIAGRSGRGKSTLIDLLLGLLKPTAGSICAGNTPIANDLAAWRRQIGIVPQNIFLLEGSIAENVAFGEENIDLKKVEKALQLAGLAEFAPDFELTAQGNLSGGQRQRIGIARALYHDVKLLILDEATSALDAQTENAFCEVLNDLKGQVTMIVISHRESTLESCDSKIIL